MFEEEIHLRYLEALTGEGKIKQARSHYEFVSEVLGILTLTLQDHTLPPKKLLKDSMKELKELLLTNLRKGDVIAEWGEAQSLLSLPGLNVEQANTALDRMQKKFMVQRKDKNLVLHRKVQGVLPPEFTNL
ncbi:MAG: hypothetical protein AB1420_13915 [Bacillota bacterium]